MLSRSDKRVGNFRKPDKMPLTVQLMNSEDSNDVACSCAWIGVSFRGAAN